MKQDKKYLLAFTTLIALSVSVLGLFAYFHKFLTAILLDGDQDYLYKE